MPYSTVPMTFDEFGDKLNKILTDFRRTHGRDMETISELRQYLDRRLVKKSKSKALRSLRGIL